MNGNDETYNDGLQGRRGEKCASGFCDKLYLQVMCTSYEKCERRYEKLCKITKKNACICKK